MYLHFCRGMVKAYEARPNDIHSQEMGDVRQVERRVSNPFWLIREVLRYGEDCVVVSCCALNLYMGCGQDART